MTARTLTPRADAAMQSRFLKALRRKGFIYARTPDTAKLKSIGQTAQLAWQYGATLDDVAAAVGLDDFEVAS